MIALIAATHGKDPIHSTIAGWEKEAFAKEYVFTNATLIVTPPGFFKQWASEFDKFVDEEKLDLNIISVIRVGST